MKFHVLHKTAGYIVRHFHFEDSAREFARKCNERNNTTEFIVCKSNGGIYQEI